MSTTAESGIEQQFPIALIYYTARSREKDDVGNQWCRHTTETSIAECGGVMVIPGVEATMAQQGVLLPPSDR